MQFPEGIIKHINEGKVHLAIFHLNLNISHCIDFRSAFRSTCFIMRTIFPWLIVFPLLTLSAPAPAAPAVPVANLTVATDGYIGLGAENHAWPLKDRQGNVVGGLSPFSYIPDKTFTSPINRQNILDVGADADAHVGQMTATGQYKWPLYVLRDHPQLVINGPVAHGRGQSVSYDLVWMIAKALLDFGDTNGAFDKGVQFTVIDVQSNPITSVSTNGPGVPNVMPGPVPGPVLGDGGLTS